jgi:hypothetical protein
MTACNGKCKNFIPFLTTIRQVFSENPSISFSPLTVGIYNGQILE